MSDGLPQTQKGLPWSVAVLVFASILALTAIGISLVSMNSLSTRHDDDELVITASALQLVTEVRLESYQHELERLVSDEQVWRELRSGNFTSFAKSEIFRADITDALWLTPAFAVSTSWAGAPDSSRIAISPELKAATATSLTSRTSSFSKPWAHPSNQKPIEKKILGLVAPVFHEETIIGHVGLIIDVDAFFTPFTQEPLFAEYAFSLHDSFTKESTNVSGIISIPINLSGERLHLTISRTHQAAALSPVLASGLAGLVVAICALAYILRTNQRRQRAETGWAESSDRYQRVFAYVDTPIMEYDLSGLILGIERLKADGITDFSTHFSNNPNVVIRLAKAATVISANPAALKLFGADNEKQLLSKFGSLFTQDAVNQFADFYAQIATGETLCQAAIKMKRLDGATRSILLSLPTPKNHDQAQVVPASMIDQTASQNTEDALRAAMAQAEQANLIKTNFLTTMSHELRTPMNGILGMSQLLLSSEMTGPQREFATHIHQAGSNLLVLLNDILDLSQIESGKFGLIEDEFRFNEIITPLEQMWRQKALDKNIDFTADYAIDLSTPFVGDAPRLRQILSNLLSNACKFTNQGEVHFSITQSASPEGAIVRFEVRDTGIGIPEPARRVIFEKFVQADSSNTRRHNGTGLGLAICKGITDLMGGKIGFESSPGEGSTFWLELAATQKIPDAADQPYEPASAQADAIANLHLNLLVASADRAEIGKLTAALTQAGITFDMTDDGLETVRLVKAKRYDAILIDPNLPKLDGIATTQIIRTLPHGRAKMPVIALTNNARSEDGETYLRSGMAACLSSPIDPQDLFVLILKLFADAGRDKSTTGSSETPDQRRA